MAIRSGSGPICPSIVRQQTRTIDPKVTSDPSILQHHCLYINSTKLPSGPRPVASTLAEDLPNHEGSVARVRRNDGGSYLGGYHSKAVAASCQLPLYCEFFFHCIGAIITLTILPFTTPNNNYSTSQNGSVCLKARAQNVPATS